MSMHVVVIGSVNVDLVVAADRLPVPGETVLGGRFSVHDGGKGANQAVAAARAGAQVTMIGAVGDDAHGARSLAALEAEGIDTSRVRRVESEPTGVAIVAVGRRGENQIVVAPGANATLSLDQADREIIGSAQAVLTNHEVAAEATLEAIRAARAAGVIAILNPAPARALPAEILSLGPILTPNEHELV
ncbi:MAG: ribokinase, partial [Chloroflexi bacterium]|nr:ribokinase [Chloroflexota bacterium]